RDAPAHLLETDGVGGNDAAAALAATAQRELAQDVVLHEGKKLVQALVLVVVRIHVDDEHVVELALLRLLAGMRKQPRCVELFDGDAPAAVGDEVHGASPRRFVKLAEVYASRRRCESGVCVSRAQRSIASGTRRGPAQRTTTIAGLRLELGVPVE